MCASALLIQYTVFCSSVSGMCKYDMALLQHLGIHYPKYVCWFTVADTEFEIWYMSQVTYFSRGTAV